MNLSNHSIHGDTWSKFPHLSCIYASMLVISQDFSFISQVFSFHIKIGSDKFLKAIVDTFRKKKLGFSISLIVLLLLKALFYKHVATGMQLWLR